MLALMLSGVVGLASVVFFFSAFFAPKLHRKDDFLWSGFGFFYALVLWICAQRFTGGILLGQLAAVCLLLAFAWQTLRLRAAIANQTIAEVPSFSLLDWVGGGLKRKPKAPKGQPETPETKEEGTKEAVQSPPVVPTPTPTDVTDQPETEDKQPENTLDETVAETSTEKEDTEPELAPEPSETPTPDVEAVGETVTPEAPGVTALTPPSPQPTATEDPKPQESQPLKQPKSKLFQWLFRGKKEQPAPAPVPSVADVNVAEVIDSASIEADDWGEEEIVEEIVAAVEEAVEEVTSPEDNEVVAEETVEPEESDDTEMIAVVPDENVNEEDALEDTNWNDGQDSEPEAEESETQAADDPEVPPDLHNDESPVTEVTTDPETEASKPDPANPA